MPEVPQSTFLVANLKELEVSGSIKLGNKTITKLLDSADVSSISGGSGIDSAATISLIDSAYVQARQTTVGSSGTDSATVINLIDSAHVQLRQTPQDFSYSSLTGAPSLVSDFTNDANYLDSTTVTGVIDAAYIQSNQTTYDFLDSTETIALIDSAYIQARQITYADSSYVTAQINALIDGAPGTLDTLNEIAAALNDDDSAYSTLVGLINAKSDLDSANVSSIITNDVDSAYIQLRQTTYDFLDSSEVISLIDSAYVQLRQTSGGGASVTSSDSAPSSPSSGDLWFDTTDTTLYVYYVDSSSSQWISVSGDFFGLDSAGTIQLIDSAYVQARQTTYDFLDSSEAIALIDSAYVQARQTTYDFLDSAEAIALIDSAHIQARQTTYTTADFVDSAFVTGLPVSTFTNDTNYLDSTTVQGVIDASYIQSNQTTYTNANFADSAFVTTQINNLIDGAPGTLDTLNEIAAALNDDDSAYNTLVTLIGTKTDFDSADAISLIDSAYVQARQTTYDFLDSAEVISLIDSAYIETRRPAETIFNIVNNGASAYTFSGDGFPSTADNPTIYLTRGKTYKFAVNASGHPFLIRLSSGGSSYSDGVTNNGAETGNVIFTVPMNAPNTLVYQCQYHSGMVGDIKIFNEDSFFDSSEVISLVDSAYVQSRQITYDFLDSSEVISLIDSAYVQARQTSGGGGTFDSAAAIELIDSAYVQARQTSGGGGGASVTSSDAAPSSPSAGDLWYDTTDGTLNIYYTDSSSSQWVSTSGTSGGAVVTISDTAPSNPASGNLWYDSLTGFMYIYYNDGSSAQWVSISGYASGGSTNSYVEATSSITALANKKYIVDTSSAITITLPAVPSFGDEVKIIDGTNNAGTNNITINRNSNKILGADSDFIIDVNRTAVDLVYYNTTQGWIISGNT